jgi:[ribosomal protein S5]-alanine N-acetyltransferase
LFVLETERMILRQFTLDDVQNLMGILSDPIAMKYYPSIFDEAGTREWIQRHLNRYSTHGIGLWVAESKESGEFIGQIGLSPIEVEGQKDVEIGYLLLRKHWNKGYATEGALACKQYAFTKLGLNRVILTIRPENIPSRRVAERLGAIVEKEYDKNGLIHLVYVLAKEKDE